MFVTNKHPLPCVILTGKNVYSTLPSVSTHISEKSWDLSDVYLAHNKIKDLSSVLSNTKVCINLQEGVISQWTASVRNCFGATTRTLLVNSWFGDHRGKCRWFTGDLCQLNFFLSSLIQTLCMQNIWDWKSASTFNMLYLWYLLYNSGC